jgi:hypothetical protein
MSVTRDLVHRKYRYFIQRKARIAFGRECAWLRFDALYYGRVQTIERIGIPNPDRSIAVVADCRPVSPWDHPILKWEPPMPDLRYEIRETVE